MECPICGGSSRGTEHSLYDDRYGYAGCFDLCACAVCDHRWLDWHPDAATIATLYSDYYPRSEREVEDCKAPVLGNRVRAWCAGRRSSTVFWVPRGVHVLDIGCGFGESLAYHRERGCEVWGVEADRNLARVAERFGFDVHIGLFDPSAYAPASFDVVTMNQVIEHVIDPIETLRGVHGILRPGGKLVISTPNASSVASRLFGRRWINWHAPYHLQFFSRESLRRAAGSAGLELVSLETVTSSEWISYQWIHALVRPPEGRRSAFWSSTPRSAVEQAVILSLRLGHRLGFDHVLTRLCDALQVGDNFVGVLARTAI